MVISGSKFLVATSCSNLSDVFIHYVCLQNESVRWPHYLNLFNELVSSALLSQATKHSSTC